MAVVVDERARPAAQARHVLRALGGVAAGGRVEDARHQGAGARQTQRHQGPRQAIAQHHLAPAQVGQPAQRAVEARVLPEAGVERGERDQHALRAVRVQRVAGREKATVRAHQVLEHQLEAQAPVVRRDQSRDAHGHLGRELAVEAHLGLGQPRQLGQRPRAPAGGRAA